MTCAKKSSTTHLSRLGEVGPLVEPAGSRGRRCVPDAVSSRVICSIQRRGPPMSLLAGYLSPFLCLHQLHPVRPPLHALPPANATQRNATLITSEAAAVVSPMAQIKEMDVLFLALMSIPALGIPGHAMGWAWAMAWKGSPKGDLLMCVHARWQVSK